jgi:FkbM family methyltransferase
MVSLTRLTRTITTTKNFPTILLSRQNSKRVPTKFRNGFTFDLTWSQFVLLRDNYSAMKRFSVQQVTDDLFRINNDKLDYTGSIHDISLILKVKSICQIEQIEKETFRIKNDQFDLVGSYVSSGLFFLVNEFLKGDYACNCYDKIVLDVGGFQGETAVFFSLIGAKKVLIYEPVSEHHKFIQRNIERNNVNAEIHDEGIGEANEVKSINYEKTTVGLGFSDTGSKKMQVKIRSASEVIESSGAEIAKFDCEGGEKSLVGVPSSILRKVRLYIIETHSSSIKKALIQKFLDSGFDMTRSTNGDPCSLEYFERRECF